MKWINNSCIDRGSMQRNTVALGQGITKCKDLSPGRIRLCVSVTGGMFWVSVFLPYCHMALCTAYTMQGWLEYLVASWFQVLWYGEFCTWKTHPWNTQWSEETNKPTCLMAPPCSLSSPGLLHRIGFSCSVSYLPPMYLQLKEIKWLCTYFCFLFLGCFYSFYFIISMCSLFLSLSFSVLYLTFFSCSFFVPKALHTPTYWVLGSQAKGRGCRNYLRVNPVSDKSVCKL